MGDSPIPTTEVMSEEKFAMSERSTSSTAAGSGTPSSQRMRTKRGGRRNKSSNADASNVISSQIADEQVANLGLVTPPEVSANGWTRESLADEEQDVEKEVKELLDKFTIEKFDSISDQIIEWANKSEAERDGRTLIHVTRLIFEKASDEVARSEVYARLCREMMETISPNIQDDSIRGADGSPITGGQLFRKYLLNRCQEDFERGWTAKDAAGEVDFYSSEYDAAREARRRGLGLIQFIGELYKTQMLTKHIVHECVKKLLCNIDNPEEEEIESLCRLLATVGELLDKPQARARMDIYFARIKELWRSSNVAPRTQQMLQVSSMVCVYRYLPYTFHLGSYRATWTEVETTRGFNHPGGRRNCELYFHHVL